MANIQLVGLRKTYEFRGQRVRAVDDVTLEAPEGKILTLLGPSGCGKTTTLRCLAGLERPDDGEIRFGSRVVFSRAQGVFVPPEQRHIGMVFQSYAIWPHMTVFENVAYPLRVRRVNPGEIRKRVQAALELVGLAALADRPAPYLSGGQQQRVALARALVYEPEVLLLDEPLSNLDAKVREQVREELRALQRQLNITTVYVTHDQIEALALSDVVAVMRDGKVLEVGTPRDLYERPRTRFVAQFLGTTNLLPGKLAQVEGGGGGGGDPARHDPGTGGRGGGLTRGVGAGQRPPGARGSGTRLGCGPCGVAGRGALRPVRRVGHQVPDRPG
jgi:iron(III) transport system ATP-binding protein